MSLQSRDITRRMDQPIFLQAELRLAAPNGKQDSNNGDKAITGVAYSGDSVVQWGERFVIDLDSLQSKIPLALMFEHGRRDTVGVIGAVGNDGKTLTIDDGRIFAGIESDPLPRQIADKAARGFPYELSVGIYDGSSERFPEGKSVTVNGREFSGPITVVRNAVLREISIVALGADAETQAAIAASQQPTHEDHPMPKAKHDGDAGDGNATELTALTDKVAELKQQLEIEKQRADDAETALRELKAGARDKAVKQLLSDIGIEYSEDAAKPYLELSDEAFDAMAEQVRSRINASASQRGGQMFADVSGDGGETNHNQGGADISLSVTDIYAKRRIS